MSVEKRHYMQSRDIILAGEITTVVMQRLRQKPMCMMGQDKNGTTSGTMI